MRFNTAQKAHFMKLKNIAKTYYWRWLNKWQNWELYRSVARNAPIIYKDKYDIRFVIYPWDRSNIHNVISDANERVEYEVMSLLIERDDVVFDVGANIGRISVFASRLTGPNGKVFAFEAVPDTYWRLCETLALNRCREVVPVNKAIFNELGNVTMNLFEPTYSAWNTLGRPIMLTTEGKTIAPKTSTNVQSDTLDHFCSVRNIDRINFLKVDVEGFEKQVFVGAQDLLRENRIDYISFEISKGPLEGGGSTPREVFETLENHGYLAFRFREEQGNFEGPIHDSNEYWANYFASKRDLTALHKAGSWT